MIFYDLLLFVYNIHVKRFQLNEPCKINHPIYAWYTLP